MRTYIHVNYCGNINEMFNNNALMVSRLNSLTHDRMHIHNVCPTAGRGEIDFFFFSLLRSIFREKFFFFFENTVTIIN